MQHLLLTPREPTASASVDRKGKSRKRGGNFEQKGSGRELDSSVSSKAQLYSVKRRRRRQLKRGQGEEEERGEVKKGVKEEKKKV